MKITATALATTLLACGGSDSSGPKRTAASLTAISQQNNLSGTAGGAVGNPPSVVVKDQSGAVIQGATVSFSASAGGLVSTPTVTTDANGVATVGTWTLSQTAGPNTLTASSGSAPPLTFNATGIPGPPASLTKVPAGDQQTTHAGLMVDIPPAVIVNDQYGNAVSGAAVTFAVTSGGGAVAGPSSLTTANGTATVGAWRLGPTPGPNTLAASVLGVTPVTFTATATANPACAVAGHAIGSTTNGTLSQADCNDTFGAFVDLYTVTVPSTGIYVFSQSSAAFDSYLEMFLPDQTLVGFNDDDQLAQSRNSRFKVLLPAGDYVVGATSFEESRSGAYTLSSAVSTQQETNCDELWVVRGVSTDQSLQTTDCRTSTLFFSDDYFIYLKAGQTMTVTLSSTAFDTVIEIFDAFSGEKLATGDDPASFNSQVTFTAGGESVFVVSATSKTAQAIGAYTISIQ